MRNVYGNINILKEHNLLKNKNGIYGKESQDKADSYTRISIYSQNFILALN